MCWWEIGRKMILFNFKSWSGWKIAFFIGLAINAFLVLMVFTSAETQMMAQDERDQALLRQAEFQEVFERTKTFDKCVQSIDVYKVDMVNLKGDVLPMEPLTKCFNTWHQI